MKFVYTAVLLLQTIVVAEDPDEAYRIGHDKVVSTLPSEMLTYFSNDLVKEVHDETD